MVKERSNEKVARVVWGKVFSRTSATSSPSTGRNWQGVVTHMSICEPLKEVTEIIYLVGMAAVAGREDEIWVGWMPVY